MATKVGLPELPFYSFVNELATLHTIELIQIFFKSLCIQAVPKIKSLKVLSIYHKLLKLLSYPIIGFFVLKIVIFDLKMVIGKIRNI